MKQRKNRGGLKVLYRRKIEGEVNLKTFTKNKEKKENSAKSRTFFRVGVKVWEKAVKLRRDRRV